MAREYKIVNEIVSEHVEAKLNALAGEGWEVQVAHLFHEPAVVGWSSEIGGRSTPIYEGYNIRLSAVMWRNK